jgi:hypothetical protein
MIVLNQRTTGVCLSIDPSMFVLHKPRLVNLELPGKKAFRYTTLTSIFDLNLYVETVQPYELISSIILGSYSDFCELTHGETGTKFILYPRHFIVAEKGFDTGIQPSVRGSGIENYESIKTDVTSLISVLNPIMWVPVKGSFEEIVEKIPSVKRCEK